MNTANAIASSDTSGSIDSATIAKVLASLPADPTTEQRFKAAVRVVRKHIVLRLNVMNCCNGCIGYDQLGLTKATVDTTPSAYTFGGQGKAISWDNGEAFKRPKLAAIRRDYYYGYPLALATHEARALNVYFNHSGPGVEAATVLRDAFTAFGFTVDWDGSRSKRVVIVLPTFDKPEPIWNALDQA
jgi:hypothetical protein